MTELLAHRGFAALLLAVDLGGGGITAANLLNVQELGSVAAGTFISYRSLNWAACGLCEAALTSVCR